ncbi:MAG: hypothetical protein SFU86_18710 [Pirellulaceae bacterium]|nr:hypothetical protein [Pirellulaceae bacterium]
MGFSKYLKVAFLNRWNLLVFGGGMGLALLSGVPDIAVPLVLAAEAAYLGLLGTHPRFQKAVDAQAAAAERGTQAQQSQQALQRIVRALSAPSLSRFEKLRSQCQELRQIAAELAQSRAENVAAPLDSLQVASFDRLLWIFLRLLYTEQALAKFLERGALARIQAEIDAAERRLRQVQPDDDSPHAQKLRRTLEDSLQTCRDRLANYQKAQANHELVLLELDRLENKIKSLAELSINRQEPDFITAQVDQVAGSMVETEKTMNELQFVTGLAPTDEVVPDLVQNSPVMIVR